MLPREVRAYAADVQEVIERSFSILEPPMRRALHLAWESVCAGSLGVGAVAVRSDGSEVATGRNRLFEHDPGDDVLAGSSLAHAEMNALAKLRMGQHEDDGLVLHTTLQPCLQCLGAIRLSPVRRVRVMAPDPIFRGVERIRDVNTFVAANWPAIDQLPITEWSVLSLLFPTHSGVFRSSGLELWSARLPQLTALVERLADARVIVDHAADGAGLVTLASAIWIDLGEGVSEVQRLTELDE